VITNGLDAWHTEGGGNAFRTQTEGKETTLTTWGKNGERDTGRLYQCFRVPTDARELRFTLSGGADTSKLRVALWQGGRLYRRMTARNDRAPFRVRWDIAPLRGEVVTLEVVDESTAPWGFISVARFELAGKK
jgi:hypothetical protein